HVPPPPISTLFPYTTLFRSKSIAVLPFTDLSPNRDQESFSDGMTEEILNALAHIKDLKVVGRASSFFYKGKNVSLKQIGSELGRSEEHTSELQSRFDLVCRL